MNEAEPEGTSTSPREATAPEPADGSSATARASTVGGVSPTSIDVVPDEIEPPSLPGSVDLPPEDQVRRVLAFFVLWIVVGVIAAGMILTALTPLLGLEPERIQSTVQFFFTATITLAGSVFGFYFASKNR